jgi:hypothetical protein
MEETRLYVIKNVTQEPVTDSWDSRSYTFAPGEEVTVVMGVALHFLEKYPKALERIAEKTGIAPETLYTEVRLMNPSKEDVALTWDGRTLVFPAGESVAVESSLARTFVERARGVQREDGKPHQLVVVESVASTPPEAQELPESTETPAPKKRSKKAA